MSMWIKYILAYIWCYLNNRPSRGKVTWLDKKVRWPLMHWLESKATPRIVSYTSNVLIDHNMSKDAFEDFWNGTTLGDIEAKKRYDLRSAINVAKSVNKSVSETLAKLDSNINELI